MIDVRVIANSVTPITNENMSITWLQSNGYTTNDAGKRVPTTKTKKIDAQVQGISAERLKQIDGLNLEGVYRSIHLYGDSEGVIRVDQKGGDIFQFPEVPNGKIRNWKVVQVMETWPTWSRVLVTLQS